MKTLDEFVEIFELFDDWDQRYAFIIDIGEELPMMPEVLKTHANKVHGCMSDVWVSAYILPNTIDKIAFHADCDTSVIKGVLALLVQLCKGKTSTEFQQIDMDEIFTRLKLDDHLSPNRHVGVYAIFELMKQQIAAIESAQPQLNHASG